MFKAYKLTSNDITIFNKQWKDIASAKRIDS